MTKNFRFVLLCVIVSLFIACFNSYSSACTDFQIRTKDNTVIIGRSMEFATEVISQIFVKSKREQQAGGAPGEKEGLTWTCKYGYIGINIFGLKDIVIDGMNEEGLSVEGLWLPETHYQNVSEEEANSAINIGQLGSWILGNFKDTNEVKEAIKRVRVWGNMVKEIDMVPPIHFAVHDTEGRNIVIEYVDGELKIYDNPIGVMTNAPTFDWHLSNLRNYVNLTRWNAEPLVIDGMTIKPTGQGSGLLGIPGDWTPPSRFIRTVALVHFADPAANAFEGVTLAEHILNTVDIPRGDIQNKEGESFAEDYTQWVVIKDLTNRMLYIRDYDNLTLRTIDLKKLLRDSGAKMKSIPVDSDTYKMVDITDEFLL